LPVIYLHFQISPTPSRCMFLLLGESHTAAPNSRVQTLTRAHPFCRTRHSTPLPWSLFFKKNPDSGTPSSPSTTAPGPYLRHLCPLQGGGILRQSTLLATPPTAATAGPERWRLALRLQAPCACSPTAAAPLSLPRYAVLRPPPLPGHTTILGCQWLEPAVPRSAMRRTERMMKNACCKRTFQVFQMFQRYVASASDGCCKSSS
jgi:hypothetical protein